ncbi:MAG: hypothetical protein Q9160_006252 [Pyrenula sp. 1 TL-2023]
MSLFLAAGGIVGAACGDPVETWTSRDGNGSVNWTKDLLPQDVEDQLGFRKDIRLLTYGYSSRLFTGSDGEHLPLDVRVLKYMPQALYLHSYGLIEQLAKLRVGDAEKRRVIFIAHSLGGLIVKSALVHASAVIDQRDAPLKAIELLTVGVLFFGTPQREMRWKAWNDLLGKMFRLTTLISFSGTIQPLADQAELFNLQIERYKSIESNFPNFSFFEDRKSHTGGAKRDFIVGEVVSLPVEAKYSTWEKIPLARAHKNLAKFTSNCDSDYLKVLSCINHCLEDGNYRKALERCSLFSTHFSKACLIENLIGRLLTGVASPRASTTELANLRQRTMAKMEPRLAPVYSTDSKQDPGAQEGKNRKVLNECEKANGLCDPTTLEIVQEMASDAFMAQKYEKAEAFYKRLFVSMQEAYTPCSVEAAAVLEDVAKFAICQGRLVEATKTLRRIKEVQLQLSVEVDKNDPKILDINEQIASVYEARGLYDDASDALNECLGIINSLQYTLGILNDGTLRRKELETRLLRLKGKKDKDASLIANAEKQLEEIAQSKNQGPAQPKTKPQKCNKKSAARKKGRKCS